MSVHPFPRRMTPALPIGSYYQPERAAERPLRLRPLTALEQMYAYWGSDRA